MKVKIKRSVLIIFNLATVLLLIIAISDSQRNRKLYIDEQCKNALLVYELNDRNTMIDELQERQIKRGNENDYKY